MHIVEINLDTAKKIQALGAEGVFLPKVQSAAEHSCMIIDMSLLREISCDIAPDDVEQLLAPFVESGDNLKSADYIYLKWEAEE